jgi:predicted MFS family arabinose efflux permease
MNRAKRLLAATLSASLFLSTPGFVPYQAAAQNMAGKAVSGPISPLGIVASPLGRFGSPTVAAPNMTLPVSSLQAGLAPAAPLLAPVVRAEMASAKAADVKSVAPAAAIKVLKGAAKSIAAATAENGAPAKARQALDGLFEDQSSRSQLADESPVVKGDAPQGPRWVHYSHSQLKAADRHAARAASHAAPRTSPEVATNVRSMMIGTAALKTGMEVIALSIPFLIAGAGATMIAALLVAYSMSQAAFAGAAGELAAKFSSRTVLAGAIAAQAVFVGSIMTLGATGMLTAWTLLPLYVLIGGAVGIVETTRQSMASMILGRDRDALDNYNAKLHIAYEVAGIAGALIGGALVGFAGPLWALMIQPPFYLLASYFFYRVSPTHSGTAKHVEKSEGGLLNILKTYFADVKAGAKLIVGDARLRWVAVASVLPQMVHRLMEGLLIPVMAKTVLMAPKTAGWMLAASNTGELGGASMLLKFGADKPWIKWCAIGTLSLAALAFSSSLPIILAAILTSSLTWTASDLRLRSELQSTIEQKDQPKALSFLYGVFVLGTAATSLTLGALIDWLGVSSGLYWIVGLMGAIGAAVFFASTRLNAK